MQHMISTIQSQRQLVVKLTERNNTNEAEVEVENMCRQMQELENRSLTKGISIGELRKAKQIVLNLIAMQKDMSVEQLAAIAGVSVDQIKEWIGNVN